MKQKNDEHLEHIRHSLAHLLAIAAIEKDPDVKLAIGPATADGFYYDFEFSPGTSLSPDDLASLEAHMERIIEQKLPYEHVNTTAKEAREQFADQPYKLEIINELEKAGETITLYKTGDFVDLCRGGHVKNTGDIDSKAFTLTHIAGAYWRGDEKNKMLTRIYGLAFKNKKELDAYILQQEEAKKRDHRKLGKELDLFTFSELVGPGLPLWTPKGTILRNELDSYVWELRKKYGYQRVTIPHFTKKDLYETSGHWDKFGEELFRIKTREGKEFAVKPMNCPHHTQIFNRHPHSYKNMPQRYSETTMVYRDEQSGELGGLTRVLSITQDDSHVFCRQNQVKEEFFAIWDMVDTFYKTFNFKLHARLSFHDPKQPEKYLGTKEVWDRAESELKEIAKERNADYFEAIGEAALYGPKLDFMATDSIGREHQVATVQLDLNLPERFNLSCINEKGEKERIVMIHCAIMGSIERFAAVLIEHLGGNFPLWLSPTQVKILPISEKQSEYASNVFSILKEKNIRVEYDDGNETLGKKIRQGKLEKVPYMLVIGEREVTDKTVALESRDAGKIGNLSMEKLLEKLTTEIKNKI